jgi:hypothetical protein
VLDEAYLLIVTSIVVLSVRETGLTGKALMPSVYKTWLLLCPSLSDIQDVYIKASELVGFFRYIMSGTYTESDNKLSDFLPVMPSTYVAEVFLRC